MKTFIDTHDKANGTFPEGISETDFKGFYEKYLEACKAEGVTSLRAHVGLDEGRAFCFSLAADADAVKRAHDRVGMPYDAITEVTDLSAFDMLIEKQAA